MSATTPRPSSPAPALIRLLHRGQMVYTARSSRPVLLGDATVAVAPPTIVVQEPFSAAPRLAVGGNYVPAGQFSYSAERLTWATQGADATSGLIDFQADGLVGSGVVTTAAGHFSVDVSLNPAFYDCQLSADAGAHVASGSSGYIDLHTVGVSWDTATWTDAGFQFGYSTTTEVGIGELPEIVPVFIDTATGVTWEPLDSTSTDTSDLILQFDANGEEPTFDDRSDLPAALKAFDPILPTRMLAEFAADAQTFVGAIVVDEASNPPLVYAVRGTYIDDGSPARRRQLRRRADAGGGAQPG
jgi:hypothetical protein